MHARFHLAPGQLPMVENLGLNRTRVGTDDLDKGARAPLIAGVELVFGVGIPDSRPLDARGGGAVERRVPLHRP